MKTTQSRTFFTATVIFLLSLLLLGTALRALVSNYMTDAAFDRLDSNSKILSELASAYYADDAMSNMQFIINLDVAARVSDADAVICDNTGRIILCSDSPTGCGHQGLTVSQDYMRQVISSGTLHSTGVIKGLYSDARYVCARPIYDTHTKQAIGIVMVSTPIASTQTALKKISNIFLSVAILSLMISMLVMALFAKRQSNPLREMARTASAFGHGDLDARVNLHGNHPEEIEELALAFNNMASSLQKSEYQRQEFVANISHELKTPMTTISGYVDGILDGTIPQQKHRHYMQIVSAETKRLSRLVRSMLDISMLQSEGSIPDEKKTRFDMEECAGQMLITFEQKILAKKLEVEVQMPDHPVYTIANRDHISQVIYNLLDNAVKFCPEEGTLGLQIRESDSKIFTSVSNDGNTIPPEELPLVFDRFHKLDKSRSQNRDGWGLGLYIVKTIVGYHGEDISVTSLDGKTVFTFTLPLAN